jgi:sugar (pentulose or hexulose) kinase
MVLVRLVGLDLGTTGVRYEAYDAEGTVLDTGRSPIKKQTVGQWTASLKSAIPKRRKRIPSEQTLLSAQSTSGTILLLDEYGDAVFQPLMYHEMVKEREELSKITALKSAGDLAAKGITISPTSPLPKIVSIRNRFPREFGRVKWILSPTTWLLLKLVHPKGERWDDVSTDWTNALKLGADVTQEPPVWFRPLFDDVGLPLDLLPRIVPCGEEIGEANSELAETIGLKNARVFQGMTDGNASALAVGCLGNGDFGFSSGSATAVKYVCSEMKRHKAIYYHKHPFKGFLAGAAPFTAGTMEWFAEKIMGITPIQAYRLAGEVEPGKEFAYYPQGDKEPFCDPELGASILRIWPGESSKDLARGRMFRSMVLGLTFFEYYFIALFEELFSRKIEEARITGGGTRSPWWNKLRASIYGISVKIMEERPGIGALILAVMKQHLYKDLQEVQDSLLKVTGTYEPDVTLGSKYMSSRDAFMKRWQTVREASSKA